MDPPDTKSPGRHTRFSFRGVWLVFGLVGLGVLLTGSLYVFTYMQRGPFRELNAALAHKFPEALPRVDGGKPRLDKPGDRILRVSMKAPAGIVPDSPQEAARFAEVAMFVADRPELENFDVLEIHFYTLNPQGPPHLRSRRFGVAEAQSLHHNRDASIE